jgi:hypothetical protein
MQGCGDGEEEEGGGPGISIRTPKVRRKAQCSFLPQRVDGNVGVEVRKERPRL